jgi:putative acetyltransferase
MSQDSHTIAERGSIVAGMRVRRATSEDAEAMAQVIAVAAEEGLIASEPPVDVAARAARFRAQIASDGAAAFWVLEDDAGLLAGHAGAAPSGPAGVLGLGIAILPAARGHGGGRRLLDAVVAHARATGAHKLELEVWPDNARAIALYAAQGSRSRGCAATTTAAATAHCAAPC